MARPRNGGSVANRIESRNKVRKQRKGGIGNLHGREPVLEKHDDLPPARLLRQDAVARRISLLFRKIELALPPPRLVAHPQRRSHPNQVEAHGPVGRLELVGLLVIDIGIIELALGLIEEIGRAHV